MSGVTLAGVSQRSPKIGSELAALPAQRRDLRRELRPRLLCLALDARLDLSRPGLAFELDPHQLDGLAQLLELLECGIFLNGPLPCHSLFLCRHPSSPVGKEFQL